MKTALIELQFTDAKGFTSQFIEIHYLTESMLGVQLLAEFKKLGDRRPTRVILDLDVKQSAKVFA